GAAVVNAAIVVRNDGTGASRALVTDALGRFAAPSMPVGSYVVEATAAGFAEQRQEVQLRIGQTENVVIKMSVAAVAEAVSVTADAVRLDVSTPAKGALIDQVAVASLPIRGRNFTEFAQLSPNVMQESNRGGLVVNGQRSINSNISVDGVDFNDSLQGNQRGGNDAAFSFPQSAIQEFQVVTSGLGAEVGRTNAGFVNVVTKSGTNALKGEAFYANRNSALTSEDAFGSASNNNSQHQLGGAAGFPIKTNKTFAFVSAEKNLLKIPYTVKFHTPAVPASGIPVVIPADILAQEGEYFGVNNPLVTFLRLDSQITPSTMLNVQYTYSALGGLSFSVKSSTTTQAVSSNNLLDRSSQGVKVGVTTVMSPRMLNEARAQWAYDDRYQTPQLSMPQISINDFGTLGGNSDGPITYLARRYELLDNVTWSTGKHTVKAGVDININPQFQTREKNLGGVYTFSTMADYLAGKINRYQQALAADGALVSYDATQKDYAAFAQDVFQVSNQVTVTAGLRWDGQVQPQPPRPNPNYPITSFVPNDMKMWQPRLGVAYDVGGHGRTVVRLSAGQYDSRTPGYLLQHGFTDNGVDVLTLDSKTDPSVLTYVKFPNAITSIPAGVVTPLNSVFAMDPNFINPRATQYSAVFERQLPARLRMTVGYTHNKTTDLQRRVDKNLFAPTVNAQGNPIYPVGPSTTGGVLRPDPRIAQLNVNESSAHAQYDGLSLGLNRQMANHLQFQANYTYALAKDDDSNERDFNRQGVLNTFDYEADYGYSRQDIRHSGNLNVIYHLPAGFTLSGLLLAHTGIPYKAVLAADVQNDGNTVNDRPIINGMVVARNADRQPNFFDSDIRLLKDIGMSGGRRITLSLEAFNITRSFNKGMDGDGESVFGLPTPTVNPNTGYAYANNTAGLPTTAPSTDRFGGPRQVQMGVRFTF
ncbi:MAG: TonB-dependent receptor, partial [Acidobacteriota bacterium]